MNEAMAASALPNSHHGLSSTVLRKLCDVWANHPSIQLVKVFGSRAVGSYRPGSDIDLALDAPSLDFAELVRIEQEVDDLLLPYEIDWVVLHQVESPALLEQINRVGKTLWQRP